MKTNENDIVLNDLFSDWKLNGIFKYLNSFNIPWKESVSYTVLDYDYHGNRSGNKIVAPLLINLVEDNKLSDTDKTIIANLLFSRFGENWIKLWATLSFDYNPINNYDMTETETTDDNATGTETGTGSIAKTGTDSIAHNSTETNSANNNNMVYGFNSATAVNSDSQNGTGTNSITETNNETRNLTDTETRDFGSTENRNINRTLTRSGNIGVTTSQQMITSERDLWKWKFFDSVFSDIDLILVTPMFGKRNSSINIDRGYKLPVASSETLGGIKVGENLTIESDGTLNAESGYTLPVASADTLGGIKVGENLTIESDGTLNAEESYTLPIASSETLGGVKIGSGINVSDDGTISVTSSGVTQTVGTLSRGRYVKTGNVVTLYYADTGYTSAAARSFTIPSGLRPYIDSTFNNRLTFPIAIETNASSASGVSYARVSSAGVVSIPSCYGYIFYATYYVS